MRLFFGLETEAPWPKEFPEGRTIEEKDRHMTFIFLGETDYEKLKELLQYFPPPPFRVSLAGIFTSCLTLPPRHPRVIAWDVNFFERQQTLVSYQKEVVEWLRVHGFDLKERFTPHVTMARRPFAIKPWKNAFEPIPMQCNAIHLYESLGYSRYQSLWSLPFVPAITELSHTADVAFVIRAEELKQLHWHARLALAFQFPALLSLFSDMDVDSLDDIIIDLNHLIAKADEKWGCPFKAVSFHGEIAEREGIFEWEMIIDV